MGEIARGLWWIFMLAAVGVIVWAYSQTNK
jgi:hypothetical protein